MEHQPSPQEYPAAIVTSPTLEALCHDLDMFINELSVNSTPSNNQSETTHMRRLNKDITPLQLDKTLVIIRVHCVPNERINHFVCCRMKEILAISKQPELFIHPKIPMRMILQVIHLCWRIIQDLV